MAIAIDFDKVETLSDKLDLAIEAKSEECEQYAQDLIDSATSNPQVGVTTDPIKYSKRVANREKDKANKIAGEIALTQDEKDEAKVDQKLSEYEGKCWDASDKAIKEVNKGTDPVVVMALDASTLTTWPTWSPPI